jgi:hypothetical protein
MVANAMASSPKTAIDPNLLKIEDLIEAARAAKVGRLSREKS